LTTIRKNAASASYRKLAPSQGSPNGNVSVGTEDAGSANNRRVAIASATAEATKVEP
jgi:hypothetical protein